MCRWGVRNELLSRLFRVFRQLVDGLPHFVTIDVMYIDGIAEIFEHCEGQPPTEMLSEFFQAGEQRVRVGTFRGCEGKPQFPQAVPDAPRVTGIEAVL